MDLTTRCRPIELLLSDVDGVLTDSYIPHYKSWERMFGEIGVEFNDEQFRGTFGRTNRDIFAQLYPGESMTEERTKELGDRKEELYREIISENFLGDALPPRQNLARVKARYPVVLHGVGLNLLGHEVGGLRLPLVPATPEEEAVVAAELRRLGLTEA